MGPTYVRSSLPGGGDIAIAFVGSLRILAVIVQRLTMKTNGMIGACGKKV
jgi:hypothetical protein